MPKQYKVTFYPNEKSGHFNPDQTLLEAARELGIHVSADCGGAGICAKCKVKIQSGEAPATKFDDEFLKPEEIKSGIRLACKSLIQSDMQVFTFNSSLNEDQHILSEGIKNGKHLAPSIQKKYINLETPSLETNPFDYDDVLNSVSLNCHTSPSFDFLKSLPEKLRQNNFSGTVVFDDNHILDLEKGDTTSENYGIAVDLGTTTVVGKLYNLQSGAHLTTVSKMNTQRAFGSDVISRISYANDNSVNDLQNMVIQLFNDIIDTCLHKTGIKRENIYEITVAGNTVMEHFFIGINPKYLAEYPFVPVFRGPFTLRASELGINIHPQANIFLLPIIGRYVGGDTTAVLLALQDIQETTWVAVDIGTNGEIVLHHKGNLISTSTAAGPAFEGAHISSGMRAIDGAIDRVFVKDNDLQIHVIGDVKAEGICGSGLIDAIGCLRILDVIDETGRLRDKNEIDQKLQDRLIENEGKEFILVYNSDGSKVSINQKDIREIQLAKGAIASGIDILLQKQSISYSEIDAIYLAGAFGQYIRKDMALAIGLLPEIDEEKIHFIGNAASTGAEIALFSKEQKEKSKELAMSSQFIEISTDINFQNLFAEKMFFPYIQM